MLNFAQRKFPCHSLFAVLFHDLCRAACNRQIGAIRFSGPCLRAEITKEIMGVIFRAEIEDTVDGTPAYGF